MNIRNFIIILGLGLALDGAAHAMGPGGHQVTDGMTLDAGAPAPGARQFRGVNFAAREGSRIRFVELHLGKGADGRRSYRLIGEDGAATTLTVQKDTPSYESTATVQLPKPDNSGHMEPRPAYMLVGTHEVRSATGETTQLTVSFLADLNTREMLLIKVQGEFGGQKIRTDLREVAGR
jgi:hypothetical protein